MENNIFAKIFQSAKNILVYQPSSVKPFVLAEGQDDVIGEEAAGEADPTAALDKPLARLAALCRYGERLADFGGEMAAALRRGDIAASLAALKQEYESLRRQGEELDPLLLGYFGGGEAGGRLPVSASLEENRRIVERVYDLPLNRAVIIRDFELAADPPVRAMLVYLEGMSDKQAISRTILEPLMLARSGRAEAGGRDALTALAEKSLPAGSAQQAANFAAVQDGINSGDAALFVAGTAAALIIDVKGAEHRGVERPVMEQAVRGSQNSFTENLGVNIALVRNTLRVSDLVTETFLVGTRSRTKCALVYIKSLANPTLVAEVRRRTERVKTDYIGDTGVLEHYLEDAPYHPFPQSLSTERPDRIAAHLAEGRVAILLDGSPFANLVPVTIMTLLHSPEDFSLKFPYGALLRIIRMVGMLTSVLLPAMYLAISIFHPEALPTDLLLAIANARNQVPFPTVMEIVLMELSFELVREGGIRVPGVLGPTIGIVGAIILGQAGVMAKIVSPIMVVIVALTGLASYTIPDYRLSNSLRLTRFFFLLAAASFGLVGVAAALLLWTASLSSLKSFGVPYMAPIVPKTQFGRDIVLRGPVFRQELRPDYLSPRDVRRQPSVSRGWSQQPPEGGEDG